MGVVGQAGVVECCGKDHHVHLASSDIVPGGGDSFVRNIEVRAGADVGVDGCRQAADLGTISIDRTHVVLEQWAWVGVIVPRLKREILRALEGLAYLVERRRATAPDDLRYCEDLGRGRAHTDMAAVRAALPAGDVAIIAPEGRIHRIVEKPYRFPNA